MSQSNTRYPIRLFRHASSSALNSNSYHHLSNSYLPDLSKDSALISPSNDIQPHIIEAKTGAQKLAFVLNPSKTGHSKSNSISGTNLSSFYIPSTSPKELPNKFIQLKRPTSSHHHSGLDSSNRKDMTRFALSRQRAKDSSKEIPMQVSSAFKRPPGLHASVLQTSDKEDDITNNLSCTLEGDHGMYTKESKNSHKEKIRRMNIIYKNIASSEKIRQTRSNMQTPSYDSSNRFFHHSGSPNQSFSKLTTFTGISNNKALFHETLLSTLKSPTQKRKKKIKEEPSSQTKKKSVNSSQTKKKSNSPKVKKESEPGKALSIKKSDSHKNLKASGGFVGHIFLPCTTVNISKDRGHSPGSQIRKIKLPFDSLEIFEHTRGRSPKNNKPKKENMTELESAVETLVRACEKDLETHPRNQASVDKIKRAQMKVLYKLKNLSTKLDIQQSGNLDTLLKDKKAIEEELNAVKEENERLRIMMEKKQSTDLASKETKGTVDPQKLNQENQKEENLIEVAAQHQRMKKIFQKQENIVKKVLNFIEETGAEIAKLDVETDPNQVLEQVQGIEKRDERAEIDEVLENLEENVNEEVQDIPTLARNNKFSHKKPDLLSGGLEIIKLEQVQQEDEENHQAAPEKILSIIRESKDETSRAKGTKQSLSDAKSTSDSVPFSTRISKKGSRSLSSKIKDKLKLDFTLVNQQFPIHSYNSNEKQNFNATTENGHPFGFHEEFMSKLDEFSFSWRQAALKEKKLH